MPNAMQGNQSGDQDSLSFMSAGLSSVFNFWQTLFENMASISASEDDQSRANQSRMVGSLQGWNEFVQAAQKAMQQSDILQTFPESMYQAPFLSMGFAQMGMQELTRLTQDWMQGLEQATTQAHQTQNDPFQAFMQAYSQSWQKILNLPQLGPERFRQQRLNLFLDNWTLFNNQLAAFMNQLAIPFEKASTDLQNKLEQMAEEGQGYPQSFQEYYNTWMKILEGHFMMLLKSEEFIGLLHNVVKQYIDYQQTQSQVLEDWIKILPVPTNEDFDALAKENYELKKRVNQLARKVEALEQKL
ncbi:MAG: poly(R)-hydroxyalkanoic acid synthase subunit PhaE [Desulfohalobiaceae bacterium]